MSDPGSQILSTLRNLRWLTLAVG